MKTSNKTQEYPESSEQEPGPWKPKTPPEKPGNPIPGPKKPPGIPQPGTPETKPDKPSRPGKPDTQPGPGSQKSKGDFSNPERLDDNEETIIY